jgi:hypothetical protein
MHPFVLEAITVDWAYDAVQMICLVFSVSILNVMLSPTFRATPRVKQLRVEHYIFQNHTNPDPQRIHTEMSCTLPCRASLGI